jgi:hypothetical protein
MNKDVKRKKLRGRQLHPDAIAFFSHYTTGPFHVSRARSDPAFPVDEATRKTDHDGCYIKSCLCALGLSP